MIFPFYRTLLAGGVLVSLLVMTLWLNASLLALAYEDQGRSGEISAEEFLASPAAELFKAQEYERALEALDSLMKNYPDDSLLLRYRAIILDQLGRTDEAVAAFQDLLKKNPDHAPTHYYLGQVYEKRGNFEAARKEWQWVIEKANGTPYELWSQADIERIGARPARVRPRSRRFSLAARYGWEYDSNVILRPNDDSVAVKREKEAGRHVLDLRTKYRLFSRRDLAVDLLYDFHQSLHDNSLNEFNFTGQNFGLDVRKRLKVLNKDMIFGARYETVLGFLEDDLFSYRNEWTLSAETRFTPRTRTIFYDRLALSQFGPDGSDAARTSRDGFYQDVGVSHYWYTRDFRRYLFLQEEFNGDHTTGDNFEKLGQTTRLGAHTPLFWKTDFDFSTGLELGFYPDFSSLSTLDESRRRNVNWDLYVGLTHHLTSQVALRGFYRFTNATNQNNFFDYDRHIGGAQIIYTL